MRKLFIIIFCLAVVKEGTTQNSFGLEFGTYFYSYQGLNDLDSISVLVKTIGQGEMFGGLFYEIDIVERISLHNKFSIRPIYITNIVYNNSKQCLFCPVQKAGQSSIINLSIEVLPQLTLLKLGELKVRVFGGLNTSFNFRINSSEASFNGRHPGVALVFNSLDKVVKPVTFSLIHGASAEYRRFMVWVKIQHQSIYSKKIEISDQSYNFENSWQFISYSIGYRFYSLKLNKKTR